MVEDDATGGDGLRELVEAGAIGKVSGVDEREALSSRERFGTTTGEEDVGGALGDRAGGFDGIADAAHITDGTGTAGGAMHHGGVHALGVVGGVDAPAASVEHGIVLEHHNSGHHGIQGGPTGSQDGGSSIKRGTQHFAAPGLGGGVEGSGRGRTRTAVEHERKGHGRPLGQNRTGPHSGAGERATGRISHRPFPALRGPVGTSTARQGAHGPAPEHRMATEFHTYVKSEKQPTIEALTRALSSRGIVFAISGDQPIHERADLGLSVDGTSHSVSVTAIEAGTAAWNDLAASAGDRADGETLLKVLKNTNRRITLSAEGDASSWARDVSRGAALLAVGAFENTEKKTLLFYGG